MLLVPFFLPFRCGDGGLQELPQKSSRELFSSSLHLPPKFQNNDNANLNISPFFPSTTFPVRLTMIIIKSLLKLILNRRPYVLRN